MEVQCHQLGTPVKMSQPPTVINYPLHEHSLELMEPMSVYPEHNGEWKCDNCTLHQVNTMRPYHCRTCQYDVCINCVHSVEHPRHHHRLHLVNMTKIYPQYEGRWKCDGCEVTRGPGLAYHCFQDQFDLCENCFKGQKLAIHRHPLKPADAARLYNNTAGWWACDCCKRQGTDIGSRYSWHCSDCEFDCCNNCLQEVKLTHHPHLLKLTDPLLAYAGYEGGWRCDVCSREFSAANPEPYRGRPYHCFTCNYDICHDCTQLQREGEPPEIIPPNYPQRNEPLRPQPTTLHEPPTEILDEDDDVPESLDDSLKCRVCFTKPKNATIVHGNTGHVCCCLTCAYTLQRRGDTCPICRAPIDRVIKHFNS